MLSPACASALCGLGSRLVQQETSETGMGRAETLQRAENGFSAAEKAGKGTAVKVTGLGGITQQFGLEGTSKAQLVNPLLQSAEHLQPEQVA